MSKIKVLNLWKGFSFEVTVVGVVLSMTNNIGCIKLNDTIVSNGNVSSIPRGAKGRVVEIDTPGMGYTPLLWCEFENGRNHEMKPEDLENKNGTYAV